MRLSSIHLTWIYSLCLFSNLVYGQELSTLLDQAQQAFHRGQFEQAIDHWQTALQKSTTDDLPANLVETCECLSKIACQSGLPEEASKEAKDCHVPPVTSTPSAPPAVPNLRLDLRMKLASAYQSLGFYQQTCENLQTALCYATRLRDTSREALVRGNLADLYIATQQSKKADLYLQQATDLVSKIDNPLLHAQIGMKQGNRWLSMDKSLRDEQTLQQAIDIYQNSLTLLAKQPGESSLQAKIMINLAEATLLINQKQGNSNPLAVLERLKSAWQATQAMSDFPHVKSMGLLAISRIAVQAEAEFSSEQKEFQSLAEKALQKVVTDAKQTQDGRVLSFAYGQLGELYDKRNRLPEAINYTRQALFHAQPAPIGLTQFGCAEQGVLPELAYQWSRQLGRLFAKNSQEKDSLKQAIEMYKQAGKFLFPIRQRLLNTGYRSQRPEFDDIAKFYYEWLDLLLRREALLQSTQDHQENLWDLLYALESFKVDELQNYFNEECLVERADIHKRVDSWKTDSEKTAILYPILLQPPSQEGVVLLLYLPRQGLFLYPVRDTSVDDVRDTAELFRNELTISEGQGQYKDYAKDLYHWLILPAEKELTDNHIQTLIVVSDEALRKIPFSALSWDGDHFLVERYAIVTTQALAFIDPSPVEADQVLLGGASKFQIPEFKERPLNGVPEEITKLAEIYSGRSKKLLDETFTKSLFEKEMEADNVHYTIIHIASHGQFAGDPDKSFVAASDDKIKMTELEERIKKNSLEKNNSVDLLTLSACETAEGDDRAALGLAGVAVKAGARSALATLWKVNDNSTTELSISFYSHFQKEKLPKAQALQQAQLELLRGNFPHPYYWSPFLLIGNGK